MATITSRPKSTLNRQESQRRVVHPLQRLRGCIRFYVCAEGLAVLLLYLGLWFWIGLLLDYGFFKIFSVDWVQELPHFFRVGVLCILTAGLLAVIAFKAVFRLFREFRNVALALVLERRFPKLLGDRLITAVELANPKKASRYGYSQAMIDQTIQDAAEKVAEIPIGRVFNWKRLWLYAGAVLLLWVGLYLVTGLGYCTYHFVKYRKAGVRDFVTGFNDVAAIWVERNILLIDTIWPRKAHLELIGFPGDELKIGRDAPPPTLHVRAWKWVIAEKDRKIAPEGWRPAAWVDLARKDLLGKNRPELPAEWQSEADSAGLTLDAIELRKEKPELRATMNADAVLSLDALFRNLDTLADLPRLSRTFRKLIIPEEVVVSLSGATLSSTQKLQKHENNEYSGTLSDLKESVRFTARAEDYSTSTRKITVVPPPDLVELLLDEDQPAYLYHRPPRGGTATDLRGLKQKFRGRAVSLAGEKTVIDIPAGTDVVLTAKTDKFLRMPNGIRFVPQVGVPEIKAAVEQLDNRSFRTRFDNVTNPIDLVFEFTDTDGVTGLRHVIIKPSADQQPEVEVQIEVLRKTSSGYICTPWAMVPFSGKVRDDHGLANVEYAYTLNRIESQANINAKAVALAANVAPFAPAGLIRNLIAVELFHQFSQPGEDEEKTPETKVRLGNFDKFLTERMREEVPLKPTLLESLDQPPPNAVEVNRLLLKELNLEDPDFDYFDLSRHNIELGDEKKIQPHYRLRLGVVATDNNVETGPRVSQRKEKFTLMIVSEEELLNEIAKEEDSLRVKLQDAVDELKDARITKVGAVMKELPDLKPEEFSPMTRRAEEADEVIMKAWNTAREVQGDYRRILKELQANEGKNERGGLITKMIAKVKTNICDNLDVAMDPEFPSADEAMRDFQKTLDAKQKDQAAGERANQELTRVIERLTKVLDNMTDIQGINDLIKRLVSIRDAEDAEYQRLQKLKKDKEDEILGPSDLDKPGK